MNKLDQKYLNLDNFKIIPNFNNRYSISKYGVVYNITTGNYLKSRLKVDKKTKQNSYFIILENSIKDRQYQIKDLLYITFIDDSFDLNDIYGDFVEITKRIQPINPLFVNFNLEDLVVTSRSASNKAQERNNRKVNKYDLNFNHIIQYDSLKAAAAGDGVVDTKYIRLHANEKSTKPHKKKYYFRYDDDDDIKNPDLIETKKSDEDLHPYNYITESQILNEIWKPLEGEYRDKYEISNYGRFRRIGRIKPNKQHISADYLYCNINKYIIETGEKIPVQKERTNILVAMYFVAISEKYKHVPKNELVVDHINADKLNNKHYNLQWLSRSDNAIKALTEDKLKQLTVDN